MASGIPGQIIASQKEGTKTGATKTVSTGTRQEAVELFHKAKLRLLNVNHWHELCGKGSATFQLTNSRGIAIDTMIAEKGNLIRIRLPAPPNASGSGYDWVKIEVFEQARDLSKDEEYYGFRARPLSSPTDKRVQSAHFYTEDATSTFLIVRRGNTVTAMERGRNEKPNTEHLSFITKIRNTMIAVSAMLGLSKPQWQSLVNGLLE